MVIGTCYRVTDKRIFPVDNRPYGDRIMFISEGYPTYPSYRTDTLFFTSRGSPEQRRAAKGKAFSNEGDQQHSFHRDEFKLLLDTGKLVEIKQSGK
jgi:hypothetical protein